MSEHPRKHVFISHHHADDEHVTKLTELLRASGYDIRNSSIRAKPANQRRLDEGLISERVIRRLLRLKISWASKVVVLIGTHTHTRPWVDWEIEAAHSHGKRIVGIYTRGATSANLPANLKRWATTIRAWTSTGIIDAIDGTSNDFENSDGSACVLDSNIQRDEC
jgi:hypothetical protein